MAEQSGIAEPDDALERALSRWENEGGRSTGDTAITVLCGMEGTRAPRQSAKTADKPRVAPVQRPERPLQSSASYRLIKAMPLDRETVVTAFEALATKIQQRDRCDRVIALQRSVDENPGAFERYCMAMAVGLGCGDAVQSP